MRLGVAPTRTVHGDELDGFRVKEEYSRCDPLCWRDALLERFACPSGWLLQSPSHAGQGELKVMHMCGHVLWHLLENLRPWQGQM